MGRCRGRSGLRTRSKSRINGSGGIEGWIRSRISCGGTLRWRDMGRSNGEGIGWNRSWSGFKSRSKSLEMCQDLVWERSQGRGWAKDSGICRTGCDSWGGRKDEGMGGALLPTSLAHLPISSGSSAGPFNLSSFCPNIFPLCSS